MSTWKIISDGGSSFRWEKSDQQLQNQEEHCDDVSQQSVDTHHLPSMAELLIQGYSKLNENVEGNLDNQPMFRTGRGKTFAVKLSSKAKARSVLLDVDDEFSDAGQTNRRKNGQSLSRPVFETNLLKPSVALNSSLLNVSEDKVEVSNSMFQTGSGKSVHVSSASLHRAKALLGLKENSDNEDCTNLKVLTSPFDAKCNSNGNESKECSDFTTPYPSPFKFQTAGGRSISVSSDALQRAKRLLGNPEFDSFLNDENPVFSNQKNDLITPFSLKGTKNGSNSLRNFTSPLKSTSYPKQLSGRFDKLQSGNNLMKKFDAEARNSTSTRPHNGVFRHETPVKVNKPYSENVGCSKNVAYQRMDPSKISLNGALTDICNRTNPDHVDNRRNLAGKRRPGRMSYVSPFKKPRNSFVAPLNKNNQPVIDASYRQAPKEPCSQERVSMRYPVQFPRVYVKEYISQLPFFQTKLEKMPEQVRKMNPNAAESFTFQNGSVRIGPESLYKMLSQSTASIQYLTKQWVSSHYKWIVWKLASYERCYPDKFLGNFLTVYNVLQELQYRYDREINHGHRSAIKKILDGDALPCSMMVLCISSVGNCRPGVIELTDGWYSIKASLDDLLSQKLASGKLFLGQKLRILGAKLCGWVGPISPFEASKTASLSLHMNGTYRCHWAERLGFCKSSVFPLAFRCIKGSGGVVPYTLFGVTRIYPVLYKERLGNGSFVVRSERMEAKALELFNQRRSVVAEGIISTFQHEAQVDVSSDHDIEEAARILNILETAAEPDILMAEMSAEQLMSLTSYKTKMEAMRQSEMQKSIDQSLIRAGLSERDITPFFRLRVVGLDKKYDTTKYCQRKGLITIWNPTEIQKLELREGQAYAVGGLLPSTSDSGTLYLQASGSNTNWMPLSQLTMQNFKPFFTPRSSTTISDLDKVPLSSEFDIAALVVYVGEVYGQKQWVFVTDRSSPVTLLAISFCLPYMECDSAAPVNKNVEGSVVGFCNLIKRPKDQVNGLWVAEAIDNSDYFLNYDNARRRYLKDIAASVSKWAHSSSLIIRNLKGTVQSIIRNS